MLGNGKSLEGNGGSRCSPGSFLRASRQKGAGSKENDARALEEEGGGNVEAFAVSENSEQKAESRSLPAAA